PRLPTADLWSANDALGQFFGCCHKPFDFEFINLKIRNFFVSIPPVYSGPPLFGPKAAARQAL
ncbi:MAG: hypothetical protein KDC75_23265, partial [Phaeodactylibacter sp.]|nr:hypothetical protein [Phaeodactylibacter sp.]